MKVKDIMEPVLKIVEEEDPEVKQKHIKKPKVQSFKLKKKSKPLVGLDIGSHTIKVAVGQYKNDKIVVKKLCSIRIAPGAVRDGKLIQKSDTEAAIANLLSEAGVKNKEFVCAVESNEVVRREMLLPWVDESDIMGLITYEIGQYLPINPESYIIQYKLMDTEAGENGQKMRLMVCAVPKEFVSDYMDVLLDVRLKPYALDTNTNALEKLLLLKTAQEFREKNCVFIDMGHNQFHISFFRNGDCLFSKKIGIGGDMLNHVLLTNLEVSERDAERLKIHNMERISVLELCDEYSNTDGSSGDLGEMVLKGFVDVINNWVEEINHVLKYLIREHASLDDIFLYGGCSFIHDVDSYFEKKFKVETKRIEMNNSVAGKVDVTQVPIYLNAICALIRN